MSDHNYKFNVTMTCGGCSGAIERVLKKMEGNISDNHVDYELDESEFCLLIYRQESSPMTYLWTNRLPTS